MQVFKTYFRLLKSYRGTVILYFCVFIGVALVMTAVNSSEKSEDAFEAQKLNVGIINRDNGTVAKELKDYFGESHNIVDIEDDERTVTDALYWKEIDYVLVVPDGYEDSLTDEDKDVMDLECMKVPGSYDSSFFETELSMYVAKLTGLVKSGDSLSDAFKTMKDIRDEKVEVSMASFVNENQNDKASIFFGFVPYLFITLGVVGVGLILIAFNRKEIKDRMECSSMTVGARIGALTAAIVVYGAMLLVITFVIAVILTGGDVLNDVRTPYFVINMAVMLLFSLSVGFFTGTVAKNDDALNGMNNVISLALCFLGGVFVPQEVFGESVLKIAKFVPTFWYIRNNDAISAMAEMTDSLRSEFFSQTLLVLVYAVAFFALTTVVISAKRKRAA